MLRNFKMANDFFGNGRSILLSGKSVGLISRFFSVHFWDD